MEEVLRIVITEIRDQCNGMMAEVQSEFDALTADIAKQMAFMDACVWMGFAFSLLALVLLILKCRKAPRHLRRARR